MQVLLTLTDQLAQGSTAGGHAETQKIQRGERRNGPGQNERQVTQGRVHGVGQNVPHDDFAIGQAQCAGGFHVFQIASAQELGTHHVHQRQPGKQRHDPQQPPEIRLDEARENDQQVQHRQPGPDLQQPLTEQVDPATVIALQRTRGNADQRTDEGQHQGKQNRHPRAENHSGQHIPRLIVGAQPVHIRRRARGGFIEVVVRRVIAEWNRREQQPAAVLLYQILHVVAAVIGLERQLSAELLLGVAFERREVQRTLIADHQRLVVGDQLAAEGQQEQADKQPQRPPATAVFLEAFKTTTAQRRKLEHQAFLAAKSIRGSTRV
ncbi:hypothetical protein D3C71_822550 [compost metagenome]